MSNHIEDLREALFETLQGLKDGKVEVEKAKAINETAQVIINSAKLEIEHMKIAGGNSGFISGSGKPGKPKVTATLCGTKTVTSIGNGATLTQHKMG